MPLQTFVKPTTGVADCCASYRRILVTEGIRRQRLELAV
jgi:hypothetical protein